MPFLSSFFLSELAEAIAKASAWSLFQTRFRRVFHRFFHRLVENFGTLKRYFKYFSFNDLRAKNESEVGRRLAQSEPRSKKNPQAWKSFF
jgi:hypothetical protein